MRGPDVASPHPPLAKKRDRQAGCIARSVAEPGALWLIDTHGRKNNRATQLCLYSPGLVSMPFRLFSFPSDATTNILSKAIVTGALTRPTDLALAVKTRRGVWE